LQNISGNIANASTVGFKGINTTFEDLIPSALTPDKQPAGGVTALSQQTITTQGTVSSSTVATNIAINGDGFFSVQKPTGITDNVPTFDGVTDYTRRGDFQVNANGNLVNGAGYFLLGVSVDPKTGNATGNVPTVLQFQNNFVPAQATTTITYSANLPATPATAESGGAQPNTIAAVGGLNPADFTLGNPEVFGTPAPAFGNSSVTGNPASAIASAGGGQIAGTTKLNDIGTLNNLFNPATPPTTPPSITVDTVSIGPPPTNTQTPVVTTITFDKGNPTTSPLPALPPTSGPVTININPDNFTNAATPAPATVQNLLATIDAITGNTTTNSSSVANGQVTLNTGTANNLTIGDTSNILFQLGITNIPPPPTPLATRTGGGGNGTGVVKGGDLTVFDNESISGGAVTVFNAAGTPINVQLRWAKTDSASLPGGGHTDTWNLFFQNDPTATSGQTAWTNVGTNFTFNLNGALTSPAGGSIVIPSISVGGQAVGPLNLSIATGALTQFASASGAATIGSITQNGFAAGQLQSVAINNNGLVVGTFSNGQNIDLASITLSHFNGTNFLKALDGGAYAVTEQSGPAIQGASGTIAGSSLENSNTDIADEFTKLIVTQQAYSANTKVITTADDMVQSLLNVLR
jgi:flagellar hook protein FlgE